MANRSTQAERTSTSPMTRSNIPSNGAHITGNRPELKVSLYVYASVEIVSFKLQLSLLFNTFLLQNI